MPYVGKPFKHDIFISYSHGNYDGTGDSILKQWSQAFVSKLESELKYFPDIGNKLSVFLDQDHRPSQGLDPMEPLTDQLQNKIQHSALLTILMSPHYLNSSWCSDERQWCLK